MASPKTVATPEELVAYFVRLYEYLEDGCGGTGRLNCYCGGNCCVCQLKGGIDCDGCEECGGPEDEED